VRRVTRGPQLELEATIRALNRCSTAADERVVELVFGFAALALDVHRSKLFARAPSRPVAGSDPFGRVEMASER
jgi:hypothetical protein